MARFLDGPAATMAVGAIALLIAAASARPYAGSWNDGSRLATVESLLDRGTLAIDDSIFCKVPPQLLQAGRPPYLADREDLLTHGTLDKLRIQDRFYSDKPLFAGIVMAGLYRPLQWIGAPAPTDRPDVFIRAMTILTSGLSYAVAAACLWSLGRRIGLAPVLRTVWIAAFAVATYAPTYVQHVNSGSMQLGILAAIALLLVRENPWALGSVAALGALAGLGFILDFGSGPPLVACLFGLVAWKSRRVLSAMVFVLGALPWIVAALGTNVLIGGVWKPLNMVPEFFAYPGSPFHEGNLTGFFRHRPLDQALYAAAMLVGKHGFLNHNLPLLLAVVAGLSVLRRSVRKAELVALLGWCGLTWLMYAALSTNMGGGCCSVRWFVPFLAPGFWLLAEILHDRPQMRGQFAVLVAGGAVLGGLMWWKGPWTLRMVPMMWPVFGTTLLAWWFVARRVPARAVANPEISPVPAEERLAA